MNCHESLPKKSNSEIWVCNFCSHSNLLENEKCMFCHFNNNKPQQQDSVLLNNKTWKCQKCTFLNKEFYEKCDLCYEIRGKSLLLIQNQKDQDVVIVTKSMR
jgi:hypothetical protein